MIRRHAIKFRTLLILVDGGLAAILLGVVSFARFGTYSYDRWLPFLNQPAAFALAYAGGWVAVLWLHGLYRPRARWTVRSEAFAWRAPPSSWRSLRSLSCSSSGSSRRSLSWSSHRSCSPWRG